MNLLLVVIAGLVCIAISFGLEGLLRIILRVLGILMVVVSALNFYNDFSRKAISDRALESESPKPTHFGGIPIEEIKRKYGQ